MKFLLKTSVLIVLFLSQSFGQNRELNKYGLYVIDEPEEYKALVEQDSSNKLVDLQKFIPGIVTDVKYATNNNFLGEKVYPSGRTFLRLPAAEALKRVQKELKRMNYELKIFDAYRPYSVTVKMYETYKDTTYVSSAWTGSRHNRGCAVDLTIVSGYIGKELSMPTAYDDFSEKAHPDYKDLPPEVIKNRDLLIKIMQKHGFTVYPSEWWHFDFNGWENYDLLDLSFEELN